MVESPAHVTAGVTVLQPAGENLVESYSRNYAQLASSRDGSSKAPIRHARTHAALDNLRKVFHLAPIVP